MRKLIFSIVGLVILSVAFVLLAAKGAITDGIFIAWIGGVLGLIGIYTEGNVRSKQYRPGSNGDNPTQGVPG